MHSGRILRSAPNTRGSTPPEGGHTRSGRSGPRSRFGCVTCKQRRVRCDEAHPICGHCRRLQLECRYQPPVPTRRKRHQPQSQEVGQNAIPATLPLPPESQEPLLQQPQQQPQLPPAPPPQPASHFYRNETYSDHALVRQGRQRNHTVPDALPPDYWLQSRSGYATPNLSVNQTNGLPWTPSRRFDFFDVFSDLDTSWAGEFSCVLPDVNTPLEAVTGVEPHLDTAGLSQYQEGLTLAAAADPDVQTQSRGHRDSIGSGPNQSEAMNDAVDLIHLFHKIVQPPAAILIGGFERWRRLQHYLCKMSEQSRAVKSALLCLIELLMIDDDTSKKPEKDRKECMQRILQRHAIACQEIQAKISKHVELRPKTREHLLAAIFLLSWFEVIRDQDARSSLFPRHLAEMVITSDTAWGRYSKQLLSWLNTLDSKATHMGRENLLTPKTLEAVAHFPIQITSSLEHGGENGTGKDADDSELSSCYDMSPGGDSHHSSDDFDTRVSPSLPMGQVKQIMLRTILQPALEWYLTSQSYCRRISAHDKHHRKRFTSDDEYEVIVACKQLESELFELWDYRPAVISLAADQLRAVVAPDLAKRLEEIFSVYLASFWILFVHLHRISWWNLPHSALAKRALAEVWQNMQRAYGEEVQGPLRKVIHPSLLWPLFLFGSESPDPAQATWAIEQLEALGEAKPVLLQPSSEAADADTLPPFRLSSGATRNAKRAAALLRELIKEQQAKEARVDDRDLSMRLFGCYFSII
ncbi:Zn(2)-C6 fungal-type DNA-binding domain protein [Niveomyces insectorum RCEF 264]|uniref:Zn(2)-C6 fungal-type DNA-binding domain protein n=1 Tax=Niveomyces insectorum RCEF 264 TaxID=1081102 RepID=A0A167T3Q2_9HYPO|nr:Zn(2)-C6 fungal-type DNA-binding domain protein [Niveomyces insectorum RCEF 264]